ncbi:protein of unknown function [Filimonas lacunae]|uniref:DUF4397 domain-containing protein n=2 Tax=Filimonas lacunae TaxID=477680 RepID=A0A1N7QR54_9BACT|nr:protein of unknown function [Filimonas lacunae]
MKRNVLSLVRNVMMTGCVLIAAGAVMSCSKSSDYNGNQGSVSAAIAVFNLSDQSGVNISLGGSVLYNTSLVYPSYMDYQAIRPGTYTVRSFVASSNTTLAESSFNFDTANYHTVVIAGANNNYKNITVRDNFDNLSGTNGKAYVRFINAVPDSTQPTVTISGGTSPISFVSGFGISSDFKEVTPGDITIKADNGATINASSVLAAQATGVYTAVVMGFPGSTDTAKAVKVKFILNGRLQ